MNLRAVLYLLGRLLLALSVALLVPAAVGWYEGEGLNAFLASAAIARRTSTAFPSGSRYSTDRTALPWEWLRIRPT